ncbi:lytic transglycosylase domain-containing protein [Paracoccus sp. CPCC 101403]|uniref:Lytic transglycosylase domain-containing protein n=2 Tax=Paracoccus broussonetiae TaxID=3075834 RepID=A0ABU3EDH4_9RHOB|nr:lytic transglycosylase domain-containing protein [Paracoccus sp. CPCC 101403]MDT1061852.1 lytic transglycosylase domain-containing protein [Paracoccus sp. CPCC 101403]
MVSPERARLRYLTRVALAVVVGCGLAAPAMADGLRLQKSGKSRIAQFERQTRLMDSRLAGQYQQSSRLRPGSASTKSVVDLNLPGVIPAYSGNRRSQYLPHAKAMARKHGVPEDLFLRLVQQESGWNPSARSHKGAQGLAQLMPGTAAKLGVNPSDPLQNLEGGARYLRMMYNTFGSWQLALAAYNAGPAAVAKYGGVPPYRETKNYVRIIHGG